MGRLNGKVALVTGAARRGSIGRAIARALAEEGADIAVNDWQRSEEAREMADSIAALHQRSLVVEADVTKVSECRRLVGEIVSNWGRLDILVNNAGFAQHKRFEEITEVDLDHSLWLHLKAPFFLSQFAAPIMRARAYGRIINISSEQAYIGHPDLVHYTAAKGGLRTLTKSLALALAPSITVNSVCPGPTATEKFMSGPEYRDDIREQIVLQRWVRPEDVARSVVFLASPDGDAFTGQTLDPNCGTVMP
jgi:NAD(P)-dependent dehydrogenase (short-subunit alcohol dehydrogenase family)